MHQFDFISLTLIFRLVHSAKSAKRPRPRLAVQWQQLSLPRQSHLRQPTTTAAVVFLADKDKSGPTGDSEHSAAAAATATAAVTTAGGDSEQSAGQFGRVVVQCSERVAKSAKAEKKAVKKKAYKKRKAAEKAAAKAARHHQAAADEDEEEVGFSYSVSYFNWAVSDSESEDSEEGSVKNVTLPLKHLQLKSSK